MKILAVRELKERIDEILRLVEEGETVEVIDRGKVVVRLVPGDQPQQSTRQDLEAFWENIDRLTARISSYLPEKVDAVEIVREGRRDLGHKEEGEIIQVTDGSEATAHLGPVDKPQQPKARDHETFWQRIDRYTAELGSHLPNKVDAVEIVRDVRREL